MPWLLPQLGDILRIDSRHTLPADQEPPESKEKLGSEEEAAEGTKRESERVDNFLMLLVTPGAADMPPGYTRMQGSFQLEDV